MAMTDDAWEQAALPLRHGGLGVRSVHALALPSYVSSLTASAPLVSYICFSTFTGSEPAALLPAVEQFMSANGVETVPERPAANLQKTWDDIASTATADRLIAQSNQTHRARLTAASMSYTAAWVQTTPIPSLGLHIDDETFRIAVALRLGLVIYSYEPQQCRLCGHTVDKLGHHGLSCKKSAGRFPRHAALNDVIKRALSSAGVPSILEPVGLDSGQGRWKRPRWNDDLPFQLWPESHMGQHVRGYLRRQPRGEVHRGVRSGCCSCREQETRTLRRDLKALPLHTHGGRNHWRSWVGRLKAAARHRWSHLCCHKGPKRTLVASSKNLHCHHSRKFCGYPGYGSFGKHTYMTSCMLMRCHVRIHITNMTSCR